MYDWTRCGKLDSISSVLQVCELTRDVCETIVCELTRRLRNDCWRTDSLAKRIRPKILVLSNVNSFLCMFKVVHFLLPLPVSEEAIYFLNQLLFNFSHTVLCLDFFVNQSMCCWFVYFYTFRKRFTSARLHQTVLLITLLPIIYFFNIQKMSTNLGHTSRRKRRKVSWCQGELVLACQQDIYNVTAFRQSFILLVLSREQGNSLVQARH